MLVPKVILRAYCDRTNLSFTVTWEANVAAPGSQPETAAAEATGIFLWRWEKPGRSKVANDCIGRPTFGENCFCFGFLFVVVGLFPLSMQFKYICAFCLCKEMILTNTESQHAPSKHIIPSVIWNFLRIPQDLFFDLSSRVFYPNPSSYLEKNNLCQIK